MAHSCCLGKPSESRHGRKPQENCRCWSHFMVENHTTAVAFEATHCSCPKWQLNSSEKGGPTFAPSKLPSEVPLGPKISLLGASTDKHARESISLFHNELLLRLCDMTIMDNFAEAVVTSCCKTKAQALNQILIPELGFGSPDTRGAMRRPWLLPLPNTKGAHLMVLV